MIRWGLNIEPQSLYLGKKREIMEGCLHPRLGGSFMRVN